MNYVFRTTDFETLKRVQEEFENYVGRDTKITGPGELTIYALPQNRERK